MIRVKFSHNDSTLLKVFHVLVHVYQIVLLVCRTVGIRYIFHLFISFNYTHWQYLTSEVTVYLEIYQN